MVSRNRFFQQARHGGENATASGKEDSIVNKIAKIRCFVKQATAPIGYIAKPYNRRQSGVVLVISLIMLLLLTLIGLSGMQSTILEEKMAGNMRDRNMAFQAAEAALQDAEQHIIGSMSGFTGFSPDCGAATPSTADNGLCQNVGGSEFNPPVWENPNVWAVTRSVEYGSRTNAKKIGDTDGNGIVDVTPALSAQPRYIIDAVKPEGGHVCDGANPCYRVTVRAQGINPNTVVVLQTIYKPT